MLLGSYGTLPGEFKYPYGVTVDLTGNIYVADSYNNRIQKYNSGGKLIRLWDVIGANAGELGFPSGVAVSPLGRTVYIVDNLNYRIQKFRYSILAK
jgi:DNA-binding beta-propeller fold protein YncE